MFAARWAVLGVVCFAWAEMIDVIICMADLRSDWPLTNYFD